MRPMRLDIAIARRIGRLIVAKFKPQRIGIGGRYGRNPDCRRQGCGDQDEREAFTPAVENLTEDNLAEVRCHFDFWSARDQANEKENLSSQ